jgi:hypothetical protein
MIYGKKSELLSIAREKIRLYPKKYLDHILGEQEAGGTSWMYLANRDFTKIGFPELQDKPAAAVTEAIQHGLFAYFISPVALFALLGGIMWINKNNKHEKNGEEE